MTDKRNSENVMVDDDVLEYDRKRNRGKIALIAGLCIVALGIGGFAVYKVNHLDLSATRYNSLAALEAAHPEGATDNEVFIVKGKTYKYSSANKAFSEVQELTSQELDAIKDLDLSVDTTRLDELQKLIVSSDDVSVRRGYEDEYISILDDLMGVLGHNRDVMSNYINNYVYSDKAGKVLTQKADEIDGYRLKLSQYSNALMGYINEDSKVWENNWNEAYKKLADKLELNAAKADVALGSDGISPDGAAIAEAMKADYDNFNNGVQSNTSGDAETAELYKKLNEASQGYSDTINNINTVLNNFMNETNVKTDELQKLYNTFINDYSSKIENIDQRITNCENADDMTELIKLRDELNNTISEVSKKLIELKDAGVTTETIQEMINKATTVLDNSVTRIDSKVTELDTKIANIDVQINQFNEFKQIMEERTQIINQINNTNAGGTADNLATDAGGVETILPETTVVTDTTATDALTKRLDELDKKLTSLISDSTKSDNADRDKDIASGVLAETDATINAKIDENVEAINSSIAEKDEATNTKMDNLNDEMNNKVDTAIAELNSKLENTDSAIGDKVDRLNQEMHNKVDANDTAINSKVDEFDNAINNRVGVLDNTLTSAISTETANRITALNDTKATLEANITGVRSDLEAAIASESSSRDAAINNLLSKLTALETQLKTADSELKNALDTAYAELKASIGTSNANIANNATAISENLAKIQGLQANLNTLSGNITSVNDTLAARVDGLTTSLTNLSNNLSTNYYSAATINQMLGSYVTSTGLSTTLNGYVTTTSLTNALSSYVTISSLNTMLGDYAKKTDIPNLSGYVTNTGLSNTLAGYATLNYLNTNFYSTTSVNNLLAGYASTSWVNTNFYSTTSIDAKLKELSDKIAVLDSKSVLNKTYEGKGSCSAVVPDGHYCLVIISTVKYGNGTPYGPYFAGRDLGDINYRTSNVGDGAFNEYMSASWSGTTLNISASWSTNGSQYSSGGGDDYYITIKVY